MKYSVIVHMLCTVGVNNKLYKMHGTYIQLTALIIVCVD